MHFCLIAPSEEIEGEIEKVRACFDTGLNCFHLRKPGWSIAQYEAYVAQFSVAHQKKIHVHALMTSKNGLGGIHLPEGIWRNLSDVDWQVLRKEADAFKQQLSVSLHSFKGAKQALRYSDYAFLSPVYDSISKPEYRASTIVWEDIKEKPYHTKIIALGGVRMENYQALKNAGFDGVAVLGAFWESLAKKEDVALFWKRATQFL